MATPRASQEDVASVERNNVGDLCTCWYEGNALFYYRISGNGRTLVVLDSGISGDTEIWAAVAPQVATFARVVVVDRFITGAAPMTISPVGYKVTTEHLAAFVEHAALGTRVVLAGWGIGCLTVQQLATIRPDRYSGMVLINQIPVAAMDPHVLEQMTRLHRNTSSNRHLLTALSVFVKGLENSSLEIGGAHTFERMPVTIIHPGTSPDPTDDLGKRLIELQPQDLERFSHPREIIAGRSRSAIPTERPDVVVDAIRDYCLPRR